MFLTRVDSMNGMMNLEKNKLQLAWALGIHLDSYRKLRIFKSSKQFMETQRVKTHENTGSNFSSLLLWTFYSTRARDFHIFLGFEKYELGSNRSSADTNIYLQTDGVIKENGRVKHVYHYKDLNLVPYRFINGVDFQTLLLFYESEKLVRIELARAYVEGTEKRKDSLRSEDLKKLYSIISQLCGKKARKKIIENNDFIFEKGYQWKKEDKIMQVKTYNLKRKPTNMLIISIKYKGQ